MHFTNQEIEEIILLINQRMNGYTTGLIAASEYTKGIILSLYEIPLETTAKNITCKKLLRKKRALKHHLFSSPPIFIEKEVLNKLFSDMKQNYEKRIKILEKEVKVLKKGKHYDTEA